MWLLFVVVSVGRSNCNVPKWLTFSDVNANAITGDGSDLVCLGSHVRIVNNVNKYLLEKCERRVRFISSIVVVQT